MSRGDEFPRYTYMMDFNPMDEDTPLRDYWQTTDDLDNEDAATIASLATQVLQSKSGYEYGEGIEVNEPALVANYMYSESRSSPQSQYSTTMPTEPAESFRGLMEDHDRGAQTLEESAASEYDFEPEVRGQGSSDVAGTEESTALSREQYAPEPLRPIPSVMDVTYQNSYTHEIEMSAAMTASRVVNGVLSRSYAGTPTEEAVNLQALQSQAPQPTPPQSESRSVSVETSDHAEQEKEPSMEADEEHVDEEPESALTTEEDEGEEREEDEGREREEDERSEREEDEGEREEDEEDRGEDEGDREEDKGSRGEDKMREMEGEEREEREERENDENDEEEPTPDTGAQQQLMMESNERSKIHDDERLPLLQQTPRKRGRPRKSDAVEAPSAPTTERPTTAQIAVGEKDSRVRNEVVESAATDGADLSRAEEMPTERKRGRPRKSEISEPTAATAPTPAKRGPGRPPKATALESTLEATPAAGKSGRPRKNSMIDPARMSAIALELSAIALELSAFETPIATPAPGKRGRPRKNSMIDATRLSAIALELSALETPTATPAPGKRGRPRKSDVMASTVSGQLPVVGAAETGVPSGKRGRPRKSDVLDAAQASTNEVQETAVAVARASSKRGRPRKSDMTGAVQASTEVLEPPAVEGLATVTPAPSKRGRPPKSDAIGATQPTTEELQLSSAEAPVTTTPTSNRRGRPRKSDMTDATPAQVPTHEAQLPAVEAPITTTPASGERGLLPKASVTSSMTTPGKRGRPPKSAEPLFQTDIETLPIEDANQSVDSPAVKVTGRRGRPPLQTDTSERRAVSPTPLSTKKRGRGRPPRSETLVPTDLPSTTAEPGVGMSAQEAEQQEPSELMVNVSKDLAVGETASTSAQEDMEATPARKRGRPKAVAVDKPLPAMDMLVTASAKKRGRPLKAIATIDSGEEHGRPDQSEAREVEEEPAAKRRRTNNDTTMEDAVDEDETRGDAQEDELPSAEELRDVVAANGTARKRSSVTWAKPLSSTMTEPKTAAEPSPQLDRGPRLSGEVLEQNTRTKQVEQAPTAPKPKTLFDMISDGRRMVRQKTYGKRSKR